MSVRHIELTRSRLVTFTCTSCNATTLRSAVYLTVCETKGEPPICEACRHEIRAEYNRQRNKRYRASGAKQSPPDRFRSGKWGCPWCADLPHRRPEDGSPCKCGKTYEPDVVTLDDILRRPFHDKRPLL